MIDHELAYFLIPTVICLALIAWGLALNLDHDAPESRRLN